MHYYMFYKPYGCVTARRDERYPVVMDYFRSLNNPDLSPVGRLDRESTGLLFITDDGIWNQNMIHPSSHTPKTYEFIALGILDPARIRCLEEGVIMNGSTKITAPAKLEVLKTSILSETMKDLYPEVQNKTRHNRSDHPTIYGRITITEGKKRQIRRMMKTVGCLVLDLKRISIGPYALDPELKEGEWKEIFPFT